MTHLWGILLAKLSTESWDSGQSDPPSIWSKNYSNSSLYPLKILSNFTKVPELEIINTIKSSIADPKLQLAINLLNRISQNSVWDQPFIKSNTLTPLKIVTSYLNLSEKELTQLKSLAKIQLIYVRVIEVNKMVYAKSLNRLK